MTHFFLADTSRALYITTNKNRQTVTITVYIIAMGIWLCVFNIEAIIVVIATPPKAKKPIIAFAVPPRLGNSLRQYTNIFAPTNPHEKNRKKIGIIIMNKFIFIRIPRVTRSKLISNAPIIPYSNTFIESK